VVEAEEDDALGPAGFHDRIEVGDERLEREVRHVTLRSSGPAPVVLDEPDLLAEFAERPLEDRDAPFALDIRERDARQMDQRRPTPGRRPRDACAISRGRERKLGSHKGRVTRP